MLLLKFGDQPCWNDPWYQMLVTKQLRALNNQKASFAWCR